MALAESYYRECLQARRESLGNTDPTTLISICNLGTLLSERGVSVVSHRMLSVSRVWISA